MLNTCYSGDKYFISYWDKAGEEGDYLMIYNISLADSGYFICKIDMMSIGETYSHRINVIVTGECNVHVSHWKEYPWRLTMIAVM